VLPQGNVIWLGGSGMQRSFPAKRRAQKF